MFFTLAITPTFTSVILSLAAMFGLVMHDTRVDKAAVTAMKSQTVVTTGHNEAAMRAGDGHTHIERFSATNLRQLGMSEPKTQSRTHEDKKYITHNHRAGFGSDPSDAYHWPSV